ncbi:hypothetical protein PSN45_003359 [Yamadazyma tenuis]|uniref:uncharacterized protein n=1 Tax=Candida tenuis TaxID=2315449 RepID=UPI0027AA3398|nr:hypothetical protein PSN45_003359 [Yamadazyma tenuis]
MDISIKKQNIPQNQLTAIRKYKSAEDIPSKKLVNWNEVYVFAEDHILLHYVHWLDLPLNTYTSIIDSDMDAWMEVKAHKTDKQQYYGRPIAQSIVESEFGGTASISRQQNLGISVSGNPDVSYSYGFWRLFSANLDTNVAFALTAGIDYTAEASCNIPENGYGALFMFEPRDTVNTEYRTWALQKSSFKKNKYVAGEWEEKTFAARTFDNPVFVCTLDPEYIQKVLGIEDKGMIPNYNEFIPHGLI